MGICKNHIFFVFFFLSIFAHNLDLNLNLKQVVVRIRPTSNIGIGDEGVKKVSSDTLCVGDRQFRFDSVFDSKTSQVKYFTSL
jgi:hypothetical protein